MDSLLLGPDTSEEVSSVPDSVMKSLVVKVAPCMHLCMVLVYHFPHFVCPMSCNQHTFLLPSSAVFRRGNSWASDQGGSPWGRCVYCKFYFLRWHQKIIKCLPSQLDKNYVQFILCLCQVLYIKMVALNERLNGVIVNGNYSMLEPLPRILPQNEDGQGRENFHQCL